MGNVNTGRTASIRTLKLKRDVRGRIGSGLFSKVCSAHGADLERFKSSSRPQVWKGAPVRRRGRWGGHWGRWC